MGLKILLKRDGMRYEIVFDGNYVYIKLFKNKRVKLKKEEFNLNYFFIEPFYYILEPKFREYLSFEEILRIFRVADFISEVEIYLKDYNYCIYPCNEHLNVFDFSNKKAFSKNHLLKILDENFKFIV